MSEPDINSLDTKTIVCMTYKEVQEIKNDLKNNYVSKEAFTPVKRCCYAILGSLFAACISGFVIILCK